LIQKFLSQNYFLKKSYCSHPSISKKVFPFPSLKSQMEVRCQTSFCQNEDGFPKLLRACTIRLRITSQPGYDGREFVEHGTEKCVVTIYIGSSPHHVEWSVTAARHGFRDTCQVVARKALRALCQIYEEEVADTSTQARVAALESREVIAIEALKQAKDEHVQKLMEAYLVTRNQRRALRIQEPASSNPVQPMRAEDP
jgi:hypothetical protein